MIQVRMYEAWTSYAKHIRRVLSGGKECRR